MPPRPLRYALSFFLLAFLPVFAAHAQLTIEIVGGAGTTIPIAIVPFENESTYPLGVTGIVGAGFVVGIRMVSEWFKPSELGTAEGLYGGWGNFGAAAATLGLPVVASIVGGNEGWRWAARGPCGAWPSAAR